MADKKSVDALSKADLEGKRVLASHCQCRPRFCDETNLTYSGQTSVDLAMPSQSLDSYMSMKQLCVNYELNVCR